MEKNNDNTVKAERTSLASACMDCLFWYRCRGDKLDCLFRSPMPRAEGARA